MGWNICTDKLEGSFQSSTPVDDAPIDEVDEGFVDNSTAAPSILEYLLTVGAGTPEEEDDCEGNEEIEDEDEASAMYVYMNCFYENNIILG